MARLSLGLALNFLVLENVKSALLEQRRSQRNSAKPGRFFAITLSFESQACVSAS